MECEENFQLFTAKSNLKKWALHYSKYDGCLLMTDFLDAVINNFEDMIFNQISSRG